MVWYRWFWGRWSERLISTQGGLARCCRRMIDRRWFLHFLLFSTFFSFYLLSFNIHIRLPLRNFFFLRGAWRDRDTNDIFAHCSLIFYFLHFKFSNFVCPSVRHRLIWFFLKSSFRKKKNVRKTTQNALAPSIFIVLSIALKLGTPLLHTQAQKTLLQNF